MARIVKICCWLILSLIDLEVITEKTFWRLLIHRVAVSQGDLTAHKKNNLLVYNLWK